MKKQKWCRQTNQKIEELKVRFEEAIKNNNSKDQILIFDEMEALKKGEQTEVAKLKEIEDYKRNLEVKKVIEKLNGFYKDVDEDYQKKAKELTKRIKEDKQRYINRLKEVKQLNEEYERKVNQYYDLMNKYNLGYNSRDDKGHISFELTSKLSYGNQLLSVPSSYVITSGCIYKELRNS